jgi:hypothetical protein
MIDQGAFCGDLDADLQRIDPHKALFQEGAQSWISRVKGILDDSGAVHDLRGLQHAFSIFVAAAIANESVPRVCVDSANLACNNRQNAFRNRCVDAPFDFRSHAVAGGRPTRPARAQESGALMQKKDRARFGGSTAGGHQQRPANRRCAPFPRSLFAGPSEIARLNSRSAAGQRLQSSGGSTLRCGRGNSPRRDIAMIDPR